MKLSITTLAEQYLAFVQEARRRNFALAADYLVMASWLALPAPRRPGGILLSGAPGMGKTTLAREATLQAQGRGWRVVRADAGTTGRAYGLTRPLVERLVLQDRASLDRIGEPARSVLARITPLAEPARRMPGPLARHQVVGAVRRLLLAAHGGEPLLLWVDDAHQVQESDAEVLMQLAMAGAPLCVAGSQRRLHQLIGHRQGHI